MSRPYTAIKHLREDYKSKTKLYKNKSENIIYYNVKTFWMLIYWHLISKVAIIPDITEYKKLSSPMDEVQMDLRC